MILIGKNNKLTINRRTSVGLFLRDPQSEEDVLLPNKYCPENFEVGDELDVFVYLDSEERKVATTLTPKVRLHEFGFLQVSAVTEVGAFMDWGLEKELLVPFKEQRQKMEKGRWYVVYLDLDTKTNRLYASNKLDKFLDEDTSAYKQGEEVDLTVIQKTNLGYSVIVNHSHKGLIYDNEIFKEVNIGDAIPGYVKQVRPDNKLDIILQPMGYDNYIEDNVETIIRVLARNGGSVDVTDKSSPEEIYGMFGMSKKAFKKSLGSLYKEKKVSIEPKKISLI